MKKPTSESSATGLESNQNSKKQGKGFQCDQCDLDFKTENGLKIHKGKSHKEVSSPEKKRRSSSKSSLILSPIRDQSRVEPCHNCGMEMSPAHQCQHVKNCQNVGQVMFPHHSDQMSQRLKASKIAL